MAQASLSDFSSLLEIAFALNISYGILPRLKEIGKSQLNSTKRTQKAIWTTQIESLKKVLGSNAEKAKTIISRLETGIAQVEDESQENTDWMRYAEFTSKWAALVVAPISVFLLFIAVWDKSSPFFLTNLVNLSIIVGIVLLPNVLTLVFYKVHWKVTLTDVKSKINNIETIVKDGRKELLGNGN